MKNRIKNTLARIQNENPTEKFYIKKIENLLSNFNKSNWIKTGQIHNAKIFNKLNPAFKLTKGVKQLVYYAGDYIIELLPTYIYKCEECEATTIDEVEDCLWKKEGEDGEG